MALKGKEAAHHPSIDPSIELIEMGPEYKFGQNMARYEAGYVVLQEAERYIEQCHLEGRPSEAGIVHNFAISVYGKIINPAPPPEESTPKP